MLSLHRKYLVHKIWKARVVCIGDQISEKTFGILKEAVHSFLAALEVGALVRLAKTLTGKEAARGPCVHATSTSSSSRHLIATAEKKNVLQRERYLISKVWRWPDLKETHELRHIEGQEMGDCLCVNPFHFSRVVKRDIPYGSLQGKKDMDFEDSGLSFTSKEEDGGTEKLTDDNNCPVRSTKTPWVKLAYWEENMRVGTMYHGYEQSINVYESLAKEHRDGFCLNELKRTHEMNGPTKVVFENIGDGLQVSLEDGHVWIHNRSESPVFLNGELLQTLHRTPTPIVRKLASGYGLKVLDCNEVVRNLNKRRSEPHSLRVSFVKGFGRGYKRQYITNCPCWIEMFFFLPQTS